MPTQRIPRSLSQGLNRAQYVARLEEHTSEIADLVKRYPQDEVAVQFQVPRYALSYFIRSRRLDPQPAHVELTCSQCKEISLVPSNLLTKMGGVCRSCHAANPNVQCRFCFRSLPREMFLRHPRSISGVKHKCAHCRKLAGQHPKRRAKKKAYYNQHLSQMSQEQKKEWYRHKRQLDRTRLQMNPALRKERAKMRRQRRKLDRYEQGRLWWVRFCQKYDNRCLSCNEIFPPEKLHRDHAVPKFWGGTNAIENLQPLCQECNSRKGMKINDYRVEFAHQW